MTPQQLTLATNYPQILDGFCYSGLFGTRPLNGLNWYWNALEDEEMRNLRLAADSYRPRVWVVPKNFTDTNNPSNANILPGQTIFYEFQVKEGSWLCDISFAALAEGDNPLDLALTDLFSVLIRQGSDLPFFDRPSAASIAANNAATDAFNTLYPPVTFLNRPRLIIPPTQLHVEMSYDLVANDDGEPASPASIQLVLLFAEPK